MPVVLRHLNVLEGWWQRLRWWQRWGSGCALGVALWAVLLQQGYCWGWFGRANLLLQGVSQCLCPPSSERVRYAPLTVVAAGCRDLAFSGISPSGRFVLLSGPDPYQQTLRLDLVTGAEQAVPVSTLPQVPFMEVGLITDDLVLVSGLGPAGRRVYHVIDLRDGRFWPVPSVEAGRSNLVSPPPVDEVSWQVVGRAAQVVAGHFAAEYAVVALPADLATSPVHGRVLYSSDLGGHETALQTLTQRGITFSRPWPEDSHSTPAGIDGRVWSRDRRLSANNAGIWEIQTNQVIQPSGPPLTNARGNWQAWHWVRDDEAVVYQSLDVYLLDWGGSKFPALRFFHVRQPLLLLEVPPEHRAPAAGGALHP